MTDRKCSIPGCTRKHSAKGLCCNHYNIKWSKTDAGKNCSRRATVKFKESGGEREYRDRRKSEFRAFLDNLQKASGCIICGSMDKLCFHHRDPNTVKFRLSKGSWGYSKQSIEEELSKCDCLCKSCHMRVHHCLDGDYQMNVSDEFKNYVNAIYGLNIKEGNGDRIHGRNYYWTHREACLRRSQIYQANHQEEHRKRSREYMRRRYRKKKAEEEIKCRVHTQV